MNPIQKRYAHSPGRRQNPIAATADKTPRPQKTGATPTSLWRRLVAAGICLLISTLLLPILAWVCRPAAYRFHDNDTCRIRPARICSDAAGNEIWAELGNDQWLLPVSIDRISPWVREAIIAVEDRRFYQHPGIDLRAGLRAALSNCRAGRIVSGASTITMQLAKLTALEPRSWGAKIRQACRALDIEHQHSKNWILDHYLNLAPFGGNVIGIEAAARAYFGKHADHLTLGEAALLAGLPQRPSAFRPDRHFRRARRRQIAVLLAMRRTKRISPQQLRQAVHEPLPVLAARRIDEITGINNRLGIPMREPLFGRLALQSSAPWQTAIRSTLNNRIQTIVRTALRHAVARLPGVNDGAALVIENTTGNVLALVGTVDFTRIPGGQINAALTPRSPGSALKPFLYLLALDGGLIVPETILRDTPILDSDYRPANFDHRFHGAVTARHALVASLNVPAVRLLKRITVPRFIDSLRQCGLRKISPDAGRVGLAAALGGIEVSLLDLTNLYAGIARGGRFFPCKFTRAPAASATAPKSSAPFTPGAVALLTDMLTTCPLPGNSRIPLAWKTGTSSARRDAWCLAWNRQYTIGVWLGNKNGTPARALVGAAAAAPLISAIVESLYPPNLSAPPVQSLNLIACTRPVLLDPASGLRALPGCRAPLHARRPKGVPLRPAPPNSSVTTAIEPPTPHNPRILSPTPGTYLAETNTLTLKLADDTAVACSWFVNDRFIARTSQPLWLPFSRGRHRITCVPPDARRSTEITICIR